MSLAGIHDSAYLAVRREFILKVDGERPILYSLDYINTVIYLLTPLEGFALSLLDGRRRFAELRQLFARLIPGAVEGALGSVLIEADRKVRKSPSQTGIGADGLFEISDAPIEEAQRFDPRQFIISPSDYHARLENVKIAQRLETPINVYTIFTHRCVADCAYCYADRKVLGEMPLAKWRQILDEMRDLGIWLSSPDNGDTFAREDGIEFLECLLEHEMHFLLSTKAYVSHEHVRRLVEAGFTRKVRGVIQRQVQLSVDAADESVARRILNVRRPRTELSLETFDNFLAFGIMPKVKAVITGLNYDQPKQIVDLFYPRGARVFHFVRYRRSFHRHTDDLFLSRECLPTLERQFQEIRQQYPDVVMVENLTQATEGAGEMTPERARTIWNSRLGCGGGWSALGIAANGRAFLCEQMKMDEPFFVGNARKQSIREIWQSEEMARFIYPQRRQFSGTPCEVCEEFENCMWRNGRCYRDAFFSYGTIYHPPPLCPKNPRPGLRLS